jgi:hypothetical protein
MLEWRWAREHDRGPRCLLSKEKASLATNTTDNQLVRSPGEHSARHADHRGGWGIRLAANSPRYRDRHGCRFDRHSRVAGSDLQPAKGCKNRLVGSYHYALLRDSVFMGVRLHRLECHSFFGSNRFSRTLLALCGATRVACAAPEVPLVVPPRAHGCYGSGAIQRPCPRGVSMVSRIALVPSDW